DLNIVPVCFPDTRQSSTSSVSIVTLRYFGGPLLGCAEFSKGLFPIHFRIGLEEFFGKADLVKRVERHVTELNVEVHFLDKLRWLGEDAVQFFAEPFPDLIFGRFRSHDLAQQYVRRRLLHEREKVIDQLRTRVLKALGQR